MEENKVIKLFRTDAERNELRSAAEKNVARSSKFLVYKAIFILISLVFLAFAVYSAVYLFGSGASFQFAMLIYIIVPLIGAALPFAFIKMKRRDMTNELAEEENTVICFGADLITVSGEKKRKLRYKTDGSAVFEKGDTLLKEGDGKPIAFRYDIRMNELRYFAYDAEYSKLRFILGSSSYPDIILPQNDACTELFEELEKRGIKKTAYIK